MRPRDALVGENPRKSSGASAILIETYSRVAGPKDSRLGQLPGRSHQSAISHMRKRNVAAFK